MFSILPTTFTQFSNDNNNNSDNDVVEVGDNNDTTDNSTTTKKRKTKSNDNTTKERKDRRNEGILAAIQQITQANLNNVVQLQQQEALLAAQQQQHNVNNNESIADKVHKKHKRRKPKWLKNERKAKNRFGNHSMPDVNNDDNIHNNNSRGSMKYNLLYDEHGVMYGKFTRKERQLLEDSIQQYCVAHNVDRYTLLTNFCLRARRVVGVVREISQALPRRPMHSIYRFILRHYDSTLVHGKWSNDEIELFKSMMARGSRFVDIYHVIKRHPHEILKKYDDINPIFIHGKWSSDDDMKLLSIIKKIYKKLNKDTNEYNSSLPPKVGIMWNVVSHYMSRSPRDCRARYYSTLYRKIVSGSATFDDDYELISRIWLSGVEDDSEIRWERMSSKWTGCEAHKRFKKLIKKVPQYEHKSFDDTLQYLYTEYNETNNDIQQNVDNNNNSSMTQEELLQQDRQFRQDARQAAIELQQQAEHEFQDAISNDTENNNNDSYSSDDEEIPIIPHKKSKIKHKQKHKQKHRDNHNNNVNGNNNHNTELTNSTNHNTDDIQHNDNTITEPKKSRKKRKHKKIDAEHGHTNSADNNTNEHKHKKHKKKHKNND